MLRRASMLWHVGWVTGRACTCKSLAPTFRRLRTTCGNHDDSHHFNGHFPGEPGLAGVYWSKGWCRWWRQLDYWSYKLQSNHHHQQTNILMTDRIKRPVNQQPRERESLSSGGWVVKAMAAQAWYHRDLYVTCMVAAGCASTWNWTPGKVFSPRTENLACPSCWTNRREMLKVDCFCWPSLLEQNDLEYGGFAILRLLVGLLSVKKNLMCAS